MGNQSQATFQQTLKPQELSQLKQLIRGAGERTARQQLRIGKQSLARLAAGLPVLRATCAMARRALVSISKEGEIDG